ncbi:MAG: hypothetical protein JO353_11585 [Phycisphaerae bacterium]|nr:hypothetical protein [Phycisphaerae bacterium]
MRRGSIFLMACVFVLFAGAPKAFAVFTFTIQQVGPNVTVSGSGSLTTNFLSGGINVAAQIGNAIDSANAEILIGTDVVYNEYPVAFTGATNFGSTTDQTFVPNSFSGTLIGVWRSNINYLFIPGGYTSGMVVTNSATFNNKTFASMNLVPGIYTENYTYGTVPFNGADTIIINVSPEPATLGVLILPAMVLFRRPVKMR